ncbi:asparagine synthase (glutamine-hydrolyzing) [Methylotenera mobilis]|uniref:asparagine synthase (glutamine-hydrolyzing) n=1 Tax=Methylotenera mobilis (strain JLW8 / ATCC BAA-1282 / DSM 17540) TaxID=583345 RepID=C6WV73_METML|nr:asparagine synthase (glutamine-hydrolyzing) [Methylotenera mobilis]ACT47822.1 Asparagine synthase (glutamine-hydrolyzing) [Methylotenera mobilis JLW8]
MCGFLFQVSASTPVNTQLFSQALDSMRWRGPDAQSLVTEQHGKVKVGHCRLSIIDPLARSDQPMLSNCGRYLIAFNGEIYNHLDLRRELGLQCRTTSDTETILEAYVKIGKQVFPKLDGMFALVIYDKHTSKWIAARDAFGIKPLFIYKSKESVILSSEASAIAFMTKADVSMQSIEEWRLIRRPIPGKTFFEGVDELLPGTVIDSDGNATGHWQWAASEHIFNQEQFEDLLTKSVKAHELSDVENVSLLSGGLDSALISALSTVEKCYTVGLVQNNEFLGAEDTAQHLQRDLIKVSLSEDELVAAWQDLTKLRGEPIGLPNEGLIYSVCKAMSPKQKVVLTGEGADELLFGYDGIYRWALGSTPLEPASFLSRYGYSSVAATERLLDYVSDLMRNKQSIDFVEDFFYQLHLPGLLRRMDFASMAASKEARVPFVDKALVAYMYRQSAQIKINDEHSKIPLRLFAKKLGLDGALNRKKIGFSAQLNQAASRYDDYGSFQKIILESLRW